VNGHHCTCAPHSAQQQTVRVALVGCGAVAQSLHLPVLAGHHDARLAALVDRDAGRAKELARGYGVDTVLDDTRALDKSMVDAVVLATPPFHHAPGTIELAQRGLHVLVEKPMAVSYEQALSMVQSADEAGVVLCVSLWRRLFPATRLAKAALDRGLLGRPVAFDVEEGDVYNWGAATLGNMRRELAGGGVLIDYGSHTMDRLLYLFAGSAEVLEYRDNALGGIESDCQIRVRLAHQGAPVEGVVQLSRTRKLRNSFRIECERGTIEFGSLERYRVSIRLDGVELVDPFRDLPRDYCLDLSWAREPETLWYESFKAEIDDWLDAIRAGRRPQLSGRSVLPVVKLIEDCYRRPLPLEEPWLHEGIPLKSKSVSASGQLVDCDGSPAPVALDSCVAGVKPAVRRVLLTGATGFIGSRLAEILQLREGLEVRALVHSPGKAARLARLPVDMVIGDLGSEADVARLVDGCDAVVHCAIGTSWGNRREIFDITVGGTRRLAAAALAKGLKRFVHISTFAVHDLTKGGTLDETTPIAPPRGSDYGESKAEAERVIARAVANGLSAVVIRPGCVYGPFSQIFTTRPIQYLAQGRLALVGPAWETPSSTVYVDNIAEAIVRALAAPDDLVKGEAFTISDGDDMTWGAFYGYFAEALGAELRMISEEEFEERRRTKKGRGLLWWATSPFRGMKEVATSAELRAFAKRVLKTEPLYSMGRAGLERLPRLKRRLKRLLKLDAPAVYCPSAPAPPEDLFEFELTRPLVNIAKARRLLGYCPIVPRERAMQLTLDWVRHARLVP
jgi:predicted dehydrogenase/nucleoside-diphosphate-sugar epimerase